MERLPVCPQCCAKTADIHGWVFPVGDPAGYKCDHVWHNGPSYDPNRWVLSAQDEEFLSEQHISTR